MRGWGRENASSYSSKKDDDGLKTRLEEEGGLGRLVQFPLQDDFAQKYGKRHRGCAHLECAAREAAGGKMLWTQHPVVAAIEVAGRQRRFCRVVR
jgi:hypothetical protein